jgi:TQXA domain-containing protein
MKKFTKIFLVIALLISLGIPNVNAEEIPSKITVKRAEVLSDLVTNHDHGFTIFQTTEGKYIYCMDVDKKPLVSGQTATLTGEADAGLLYILQNGYPNKGQYMTGNAETDKYITQAAVWWYTNEAKLSSEFKNATKETDRMELVKNNIKPMVEKATAAKNNQTTPSMKISQSGNSLELTSDKKYYESKYISAALVNAENYTVTTNNEKASIVSEDGKTKTTFKSSERFKVRIPASSIKENTTLKLDIKASGNIKVAKIYKPSNSEYQRVVGLYNEEKPLSQTLTLTSSKTQKICQEENGKYYGKDGNEIDKETFDRECGQEVTVPNTSANIIFLGVAVGILAIVLGVTLIYNRASKRENSLNEK